MAAPRKTGTQRGGRKKPPATAQGHRESNVVHLEVHNGGKLEVPKPPMKLGVVAAATWEAFWTSALAMQVEASDHFALRRWIEAVQERQDLLREIKRLGVTTSGSTGQVRMNPLYKRLGEVEAEVARGEQQFGMTPLARLKLGLAIGGNALTAEKINELARKRQADADQSKPAGNAKSKAKAGNQEEPEVIDGEVVGEGYEPA